MSQGKDSPICLIGQINECHCLALPERIKTRLLEVKKMVLNSIRKACLWKLFSPTLSFLEGIYVLGLLLGYGGPFVLPYL